MREPLKQNCLTAEPTTSIADTIAASSDPCKLIPVLQTALYAALAGQATQSLRFEGKEIVFHAPAPEQLRQVLAALKHECGGASGSYRAIGLGPRKLPYSHPSRRSY